MSFEGSQRRTHTVALKRWMMVRTAEMCWRNLCFVALWKPLWDICQLGSINCSRTVGGTSESELPRGWAVLEGDLQAPEAPEILRSVHDTSCCLNSLCSQSTVLQGISPHRQTAAPMLSLQFKKTLIQKCWGKNGEWNMKGGALQQCFMQPFHCTCLCT